METSSSLAAASSADFGAARSGTIVATALIDRAKTPQVRASFSIWAFSAGSSLSRNLSRSVSIFSRRRVCSISLQPAASSLLPAMTQRYGASGRG